MKRHTITALTIIAIFSTSIIYADENAVGTWQGTDQYGDAINFVLHNNGTISGTWEEDLSPDCIIYWDISGTYNFNPANGHLTFCFDDRKYCVDGIELRTVACIDGYMTDCDYASGTSSGTGYVYYNGDLVDQMPLEAVSWTVSRVSMPYQAVNPGPSNGASNRSIDIDLSWSNGGGACTFNVYFGTDPSSDSGESKGNRSGTTYDPGTLLYETKYYWRIDTVNTNGTTTGTVWMFTTESPPPQPSIAKDQTDIDFGDISISETFDVWNDGTGTLNYNVSISEGGSYFSVLPSSGSSTGSGDKNTHTISVDRSSIELGATVSGEVQISSGQADDSPQVIQLSAEGDPLPDPTILLSDPNGGEILMAPTTETVSWSSTGLVSNVSIEYSDANGIDGSWTVVEASTPNDGEYEWTVPVVNSEQCIVRVSDASNASFFDISDDVFTIYQCQVDPAADLNNDCKVNMPDLAIASAGWGDVYDISNLSALANDWLGNGNPFEAGYTEPLPIMWVYIDDDGAGMKNENGDPISHGGFTGYMSKYETTNAQYCQYLNAAKDSNDITVSGDYVMGTSGPYSGQGYYRLDGPGYTGNEATDGGAARINWTGNSFTVDSGFDNHPVTYVSWYGSTAFASYYGWRLPTEWQWQAVADYDGTYTYGCGTSIDNGIANYSGSTHPDGTSIVGSFGTYGYGMCDMAGNTYEWTSSVYGSSFCVIRGGSWLNDANECAVSEWTHDHPNEMYIIKGFRVCR